MTMNYTFNVSNKEMEGRNQPGVTDRIGRQYKDISKSEEW